MDRVVAIKITSDGKAFVVDQGQNAEAVARLEKQVKSLQGELDRTQKKLGETGAAAPKLKPLGDQAERTAQQMRQVAPQITDIVTQLAAGQSPMQIFIQQGGQLKDVFGGAGPALRAVGGYVAGMITPLSVAAVGVGGLAAAWYLGHEESVKFNQQLILSGNAAGVSASQYHEIATGLSAIAGTKGAALEAVSAMAEGGRVAAENLQRYTALAQQLDRLVAKPVADTAKEFIALGEAPLEASVRLNRSYNYLTGSVYEQIRALQQQGQYTAAAKVAQDAFAEAMEDRIPKMRANLGTLERGWLTVKDAIKGAGDALLNIGRIPSIGEQIATLKREIAKAQGPLDASAFSGNAEAKARLQANKQLLTVLEGQAQAEAASAHASSERNGTLQARIRFDAMEDAALTNQKKLKNEIAKAEADGLIAGKSRVQIEAVIADLRKKYVDQDAQDALGGRIAALKRAGEVEAILVKENIDHINALYKLGAATQAEYIDAVGAAEVKLLEHDRARLAQELEITKKKANSQREAADLEGQLAVQSEKIAARRRKIDEDQINRRRELEKKAREAERAELQQWEDEQNAAQVEAGKRYEALQLSVTDYIRGLQDESDALDFQVSLLGQSAVVQQRMIELHRIDLGLREKLRDIDRQAAGGQITNDRAEFERQRAREAAAEAAAKTETGIWVKEWSHANTEIGETLYLIITGRGKDARQKLMALFEQTVLRPTIMGVMQPIANGITNALVGGGAQGGAGSALSGIGNAASMYSGASGIGSAFMAGYAGTGAGSAFAAGGAASGAFGVGGGMAGASGMAELVGTGATVAGAGGGVAAGASAAMAAIPVAGWIALAAVALYSIFSKDGGGPKGNAFAQTPGMTGVGALPGDVSKELTQAAQVGVDAITGGYMAAANALGIQAGNLQAALQANTDPEGDSLSHLAAVVSLNGRQVYDRNNLTNPAVAANNAMWEDIARDPEAMKAAMQEAIARGLLAAIKASDLTGKVKTYFDSLNPLEMSADQITAAITAATNATKVWAVFKDLGPVFSHFTDLTVEATSAFIAASGGIEQATANLTSYYENFYSAEEKRQLMAQKIAQTLNAGGIGFDAQAILTQANGSDPRAWFRAVVEEYAKMGPAGEQYVATMLKANGAFASIIPTTDAAASTVTGEVVPAVETLEQALARLRNPLRDVADIAANIIRLEGETDSLRVQLLRAQGTGGAASALQRQIDTKGLTAVEIAIYDYNATLRAQGSAVEDANSRVDSAVADLTRARESEASSIQTQLSALTGSSSALRHFAQDLRQFRDSLLLGNLSPLTPGEKLAEAGRQFEATYAAALKGDETALGRLQGVSQEFLQASQTYNASSTAYLADFARVQMALTLSATSADAQAHTADEQTALLRSQLSALDSLSGTVASGTLTVAGAIDNLRTAILAAQGLGTTVNSAVLGQAGMQPADTIRGLYASAIGVSNPDAEGLAFWTQRLQSGVPIAQLTLEMQESAKVVRGYATGGLASGVSLVGEQGRELVDFSTPGRVYTAQQTAGMFGTNDALLAEVRGLRDEVRGLKEQVRASAGQQVNALVATSEANAQRTGEIVGNAINRGAFVRKNAREAATS